MHLPNIPNISKISLFVISCLGRCYSLREVGQWMWSVIGIPPCLHGIVDYLSVVFPGLCHSVPVLFARETWSGWGGTQWRLSVGLPLPCGGSYFTSSHFLFLFWLGWAQCSRQARHMAGFQGGCARRRKIGRESEFIGAPSGILMLSEFNPSSKTVILRSTLFVLCFLSGTSHFVSLGGGWVWPLLAAFAFVETEI